MTSKATANPSFTNQSRKKRQRPNGGGELDKLSRTLALVLRHKALEMGFTMTPDGYVQVDELVKSRHPRLKGCTVEKIRQVVETNNKQRYKLEMKNKSEFQKVSEDDHRNKNNENNEECMVLCVRANQGHSISTVDSNLLLRPLNTEDISSLPMVVHGTNKAAWKSINKTGLKRMNRNHIHFATGLPKDGGVISGMRQSCDVYIYIDTDKCLNDGVQFYQSDNGVVLCAGTDGVLHKKYFASVTNAEGIDLLNCGNETPTK